MKTFLLALALMPALAFANCRKEKVLKLHPTQMDVGYREVAEKVDKVKGKAPKKLEDYLEKNPAPVVIGPDQQLYIYDHQHLALALYQANVDEMCVDVSADLSAMKPADFWQELQKRKWVYLFDNLDQAVTPEQLPYDVTTLQDDPYRSLAWQVRENSGYEKTDTPFAEFQWAHFFRSRVAIGATDRDFEAAVARALDLAHSEDAKDLPGWTNKAQLP
jgi:hypothetical protein